VLSNGCWNLKNMFVLSTGETGFGQNPVATLGGAKISTSKLLAQRVSIQTVTIWFEPVGTDKGSNTELH
jgi:hypothetical protein